jgi:NAD(P)-dependent dehydrogenase (short-subunit alcohol dehydrogenase family)
MGMLDGKVALITGGSRGQGRAHAVTSAREGADVIIVDIADQMATVPYTMATAGDLDETVKLVEAYDRRALAIKADVRSQQQLDQAVERGIAEFGKIDILIANAGIWTQAPFWELTDDQWEERTSRSSWRRTGSAATRSARARSRRR